MASSWPLKKKQIRITSSKIRKFERRKEKSFYQDFNIIIRNIEIDVKWIKIIEIAW